MRARIGRLGNQVPVSGYIDFIFIFWPGPSFFRDFIDFIECWLAVTL